MLASLVAALLATSAVEGMSDPALDAAIADAHRLQFRERIGPLSKLFLGTSYGDFPLGDEDGPEPGLRWRVDRVDCQTYVETVLAMANARNLSEAKRVLDDIRYADGRPDFSSRNHFTEAQWLPANTRKGYLRDDVGAVDRSAPRETLVLERAQWSKVPGLQRLVPANIPDGKYSVRYLSLDAAKKKAAAIAPGTVLMVVREYDPNRVVRISHMGFVVKDGDRIVVRHASTGEPRAVVDEEFSAFIDRQATYKKWKVAGVALARPLDAAARVARLGTRAAR